MNRLSILCLLFLLLSKLSVLASVADEKLAPFLAILEKPQINDADYEWIAFRVIDRPAPLLKDLRQKWQELPSDQNPLLKARVGWLILRIMGDGESDAASEAELPGIAATTLVLIQQHNLPISLDEVKFYHDYFFVFAQKHKFEDVADGLLELARAISSPYAKAFALSLIAFEFNERRLRKELLPGMLHELRTITAYRQAKIPSAHMPALQRMGSLVAQIGESEEAALISSQLLDFCKTRRAHKICTKIIYERGRSLNQEPGIEKARLAIEAFREALQLSEEVQSRFMIAACHYGLTIAYLKTEQFQEAIRSGTEAYRLFEAVKINDWAASTLRYLSEAYLKSGDKQLALSTIQKALEICPPDSTQDVFDIYKQFAAVHKALGSFEKAYNYLELYRNLEQEFHRDSVAKQLLELRNNSELRVQEQKNKALASEVKWKDQELKKAQYLRLLTLVFLVLALLIIALLGFSFVKARLARTIQEKMKAILENIDEGIVMIDGKLMIQSTHSRHLAQLFRDEAPFENCYFIERILRKFAIESDRLALVEQILRLVMGEGQVNWILNEDNLPKELFLKDEAARCFTLHWVPILNKDEQVTSILLTLRDITSRRQLERDVALERDLARDRTEILGELLKGDLTASFQVVSHLKQLHERLIHEDRSPDAVETLRLLHTSKGVSRSLGLRRLSSAIHDWEANIQALQAGRIAWPELSQRLKDDQPLLDSYFVLANLGMTSATAKDRNLIALVSDLQASIQEQARQAAIGPVQLLIQDNWCEWDPALMASLAEVLPHLLANALDHGFILPGSRKRPRIEIEAEALGTDLRLTIRDNGVGLNLAKLKDLAERVGFQPAPAGSVADVIFQDGISTAASATATSGRGVGLAAVKAKIEALAGRIRVQSQPSGGTAFVMEIPGPAAIEKAVAV